MEMNYSGNQRAQLPQALKQALIGAYILYSDTLKTAESVRREAVAHHGELVEMYHKTKDPEVKRAMHATGKTIAKALKQVDCAETIILACEAGLGCLESYNRRNEKAA